MNSSRALPTMDRIGARFHVPAGFARSGVLYSCLQAVDLQCVGSRKPSGGMSDAPVKAGSKSPKGDQAGFEPAREGMDAGSCERQPVRGNGAPALVTLPHYASPDGGPMGSRASRRRGTHLVQCAGHHGIRSALIVSSAQIAATQRRTSLRTAAFAHASRRSSSDRSWNMAASSQVGQAASSKPSQTKTL